jgi:hypothetical protein
MSSLLYSEPLSQGAHQRSESMKTSIKYSMTLFSKIIDAKGTYIEDSSKKIARHDIHGQAEALNGQETLPIDPVAMDGFNPMLVKLENGDGVSFVYDLSDWRRGRG